MTKKEEYDLIVDGKRVKEIVRKDSNGNVIDRMFRLKKGESGMSPHIIRSNPEESHIDEFEDGEKIGVNRSV